jgi:hypothetical protein
LLDYLKGEKYLNKIIIVKPGTKTQEIYLGKNPDGTKWIEYVYREQDTVEISIKDFIKHLSTKTERVYVWAIEQIGTELKKFLEEKLK